MLGTLFRLVKEAEFEGFKVSVNSKMALDRHWTVFIHDRLPMLVSRITTADFHDIGTSQSDTVMVVTLRLSKSVNLVVAVGGRGFRHCGLQLGLQLVVRILEPSDGNHQLQVLAITKLKFKLLCIT